MSVGEGDSLEGFVAPGSSLGDSQSLLELRRRWPDGTMLADEHKGPPRDGSIRAPLKEADLPACTHAPGGPVPIGRMAPMESAVLHGPGFVVRVTGRTALDTEGKRWIAVIFAQRESLVKGVGWLPVSMPCRRVVFRHEAPRPVLPANVAQVASHGALMWLAIYEDDRILGHLIGHEPIAPLVDSWARGERVLLTGDQARHEWKLARDALSVQYALALPDAALQRKPALAPRA